MSRRDGGAPSQRQLRVGERIRHLLAEDLQRGALGDPRLESANVTVAEVRMSPDLKHARVYVTELGARLRAPTREALQAAAPVLGGRLARAINLKYAPKLSFVEDPSFAEAERIEGLIARARAAGAMGDGGGADDGA
jgi:ribosome-binding factor A